MNVKASVLEDLKIMRDNAPVHILLESRDFPQLRIETYKVECSLVDKWIRMLEQDLNNER